MKEIASVGTKVPDWYNVGCNSEQIYQEFISRQSLHREFLAEVLDIILKLYFLAVSVYYYIVPGIEYTSFDMKTFCQVFLGMLRN
jgi:hypothetical protein